jgi:dolichol-phosphate mannosyltransferase
MGDEPLICDRTSDNECLETPLPGQPGGRGPTELLSIVVAAYNEEGNLPVLLERLVPVLRAASSRCEVIIVDDGSEDGTWEIIRTLASKFDFVIGLRLSRNFGHQNALVAGLRKASGSVVVTMDSDLQHPPEVIPALLAAWQGGAEIVNTKRISGAETNLFKRLTSKYFYAFLSHIGEVQLTEGASDFRLMGRRPLDGLLSLNDKDLFLRGAVQWIGFKQETVEFDVAPRYSGRSKYGVGKMLRFAASGIVGFSDKPLRLGIWIGFGTGVLAASELIYIVIQYLLGNTVPGWASTVGIISLLFAVLFVLMGITGLYLSAIHRALQGRPRFVVSEETGLHSDRLNSHS